MEDFICKADLRIKPKSKKALIIKIIISVIFIGLVVIPIKVSGRIWLYSNGECHSSKYYESIVGVYFGRFECTISAKNHEEWEEAFPTNESCDYDSNPVEAKELLDHARTIGFERKESRIYMDSFIILLAYIVVIFIIPLIWRACIKFIVKGCSLQLDKDEVNGNRKKLFSNKSLNLPIEKVDSITIENSIINKLLGGETIAVRSASGLIKFICVYNASEFVDKTLSAIKDYKESAKSVSENIQHNSENRSNSVDDIMKLKQLLDAGIITQEEFDAKKKELLNL